MTLNIKDRFPGLANGWSRFDGPAGTQVVDTAIEAMSAWQRSGNNANSHGQFAAAHACDELVASTQGVLERMLGGDADGFMFGPSTSANTFSITRAIGRTLGPGDEIICTKLDHDSNVSPWLEIANDTGATVRIADFDPDTGELSVSHIAELLSENTQWVAFPGASNAIGSAPDVAAIAEAAHSVDAKVVVDGVHLTPHRQVDIAALGADVYSTSSYKWYGPHAGITWLSPDLRTELKPYKVRPADDDEVSRFALGTPSYEAIAGIAAAAEFVMSVGYESIVRHETAVFARLLDGLRSMDNVTVYGSTGLEGRVPTTAVNVDGMSAESVAAALGEEGVAVWDGHYYAIETMAHLGIEGAVRAGVVAYIEDEDVDRLLAAVASL